MEVQGHLREERGEGEGEGEGEDRWVRKGEVGEQNRRRGKVSEDGEPKGRKGMTAWVRRVNGMGGGWDRWGRW